MIAPSQRSDSYPLVHFTSLSLIHGRFACIGQIGALQIRQSLTSLESTSPGLVVTILTLVLFLINGQLPHVNLVQTPKLTSLELHDGPLLERPIHNTDEIPDNSAMTVPYARRRSGLSNLNGEWLLLVSALVMVIMVINKSVLFVLFCCTIARSRPHLCIGCWWPYRTTRSSLSQRWEDRRA